MGGLSLILAQPFKFKRNLIAFIISQIAFFPLSFGRESCVEIKCQDTYVREAHLGKNMGQQTGRVGP